MGFASSRLKLVSTHSRPKAAGSDDAIKSAEKSMFQHTAARRRLESRQHGNSSGVCVSKHSRPKAAGFSIRCRFWLSRCFNTQPPEGGWLLLAVIILTAFGFNTQPPEGGWFICYGLFEALKCFNTQPPEGGWGRRSKVLSIHLSFNTQPPEGGWQFRRDYWG